MTSQKLLEYWNLLPMGLMGLAILLGIVRLKKLGLVQKWILLLVFVALLSEMISRIIWKNSGNTFPVFHIYALIEYSILAMVFAKGFLDDMCARTFRSSIVIVGLFGIANIIFWQPLTTANTNVTTVTSVLLIISSVALFFKILNDMRYKKIQKSALFWVNIGVLTYFSSSFILFNFADWLMPVSVEHSIDVWMLHIFFNVIHYLTFTIALWMKPE